LREKKLSGPEGAHGSEGLGQLEQDGV
jgi:hypothetical protein